MITTLELLEKAYHSGMKYFSYQCPQCQKGFNNGLVEQAYSVLLYGCKGCNKLKPEISEIVIPFIKKTEPVKIQQPVLLKPQKPIKSEIADKEGNVIVATETENEIRLLLKLKSETSGRHIGTIIKDQRVLFVERDREKHLFRKANGYGFNYDLIKNAKRFDHVLLRETNGRSYMIPNNEIITGGVMFFKKQGFEVQVFLSMDIIETFKK